MYANRLCLRENPKWWMFDQFCENVQKKWRFERTYVLLHKIRHKAKDLHN